MAVVATSNVDTQSVIYRNGAAETNEVIPKICNSLKVVAHIPFGIYLRVSPYTQGTPLQIPNDILLELKEYQERIVAVTASLATFGFSEPQLLRQREILDRCKSYLDQLVVAGRSPYGAPRCGESAACLEFTATCCSWLRVFSST